jgi:hypothetical protein
MARRTRPRRGRRRSAITRCWCFWIAPRSPGVRRWPGCCAPATPGPTPPLITSPCCGGRWTRCRRATGPTLRTLARSRFWCAAIPPGPPTLSPRPAAPRGGILLRLRRRCPGPGCGRNPHRGQLLVSGDRVRRRPARGRLGRRGHHPGRHERLAGRDPADPSVVCGARAQSFANCLASAPGTLATAATRQQVASSGAAPSRPERAVRVAGKCATIARPGQTRSAAITALRKGTKVPTARRTPSHNVT